MQVSLSSGFPKMGRSMLLLLLCASVASLLAPGLKLLALAQQIPGFISINCGAPDPYLNDVTGIYYETDQGFTDSGENKLVSAEYSDESHPQITKSLRSFPNGTRNCYTLKPDGGKNSLYLIRTYFWYGNYDRKRQTPTFDLYIDVNYWTTIDYTGDVFDEIIYVSKADYIQVCVVNTGSGIPYLSALELRVLGNSSIYRIEPGFLRRTWLIDVGTISSSRTRYPTDDYDRIWLGHSQSAYFTLTPSVGASAASLSDNNDAYKVPGKVLMTAGTASNASSSLSYNWTQWKPYSSSGKWILYFHFAETQSLLSGQQREFTVSVNGNQFTKRVALEYLKPVTLVSTPVTGSPIVFTISPTPQSAYPPILNAIEVYNIVGLPNVPTAQIDVKAINDTKATYRVNKESWQGDPCVPSNYTWHGLNCSYGNPPRIISLNLSSSDLVGSIASSFSNLLALESLDLSNNQLSGEIPETLAKLPKLRNLNLSGNNLTGSVPKALTMRVEAKTLNLSLTGNANLCRADPCAQKQKQKTILIPVITSVSGFFVVLFGALAIIWLIKRRAIAESSERVLRPSNRPFTYEEVSIITGNFGQVIGEGGFGKVYLGTLDNGTVVAVKMLSESSKQGYKEFQTEAQLLMIVHHRNLVSLFGYCNESKHLALIYEYMANGNLKQHLSGNVIIHPTEDHPKVLTWSNRLQVAVDAAQGLDYLHNGCKPPIIHRDLKTINILLNDDFRAKISDFGLSRAFATEKDSHVSTCLAGTRGYLDPEMQSSGKFTKKSDVYSFGIILFELITGQPAFVRSQDGSNSMHVLEWLTPIVESGDIQRIMDPRLQGVFDINSAWKVAEIAMSCTRPTAIQRPDIHHVLAELESLVSKSSDPLEMSSLVLQSDDVPIAR
ncbi:senescence-induced receptor-like serine/threonine-protein kinase [Rhodamnia argentea]|uniref:non-specific serine/threonine protein kinase n=1 Tax=Rhodamnia argentea TaxID=178133 RepID=A0ABM3HS05_9MYRT|nr:senescence-induced receptor-like serine/threonine-protein kinase [Rhodamnia argentea]